MGNALMTEKKGSKKPDATEAAGEEEKEKETTTRMFVKEAAKLSKLAALRGESSAKSFRAVFGKLLDAALKAAAKGTIEEIDEEDR